MTTKQNGKRVMVKTDLRAGGGGGEVIGNMHSRL
jgi:hypothetical protein